MSSTRKPSLRLTRAGVLAVVFLLCSTVLTTAVLRGLADGGKPAAAVAAALAVQTRDKRPVVDERAPASANLLAFDFSKDGSLMAAAGDSLWLFETEPSRLRWHFKVDHSLRSVVFSPMENWLVATGGRDGVIRLLDARKKKPVHVITAHAERVYGLAYAPDGKQLASVGTGRDQSGRQIGQFKLWNIATGKLVREMTFPDVQCRCVAFSSDGTRLAFSQRMPDRMDDSAIYVYDTRTWELIRRVPFGPGFAQSVTFAAGGSRLIITGGVFMKQTLAGRIWLADLGLDGAAKLADTKKCGYYRTADLVPAGATFATGTTFKHFLAGRTSRTTPISEIQMRRVDNGRILWTQAGGPGEPHGVSVSPDGRLVGCCSRSKVLLFDAQSGNRVRELDVRDAQANAARDPSESAAATESSRHPPGDPIRVAVSGTGKITIAGKAVTLHELPTRVGEAVVDKQSTHMEATDTRFRRRIIITADSNLVEITSPDDPRRPIDEGMKIDELERKERFRQRLQAGNRTPQP